MNTHALSTRRLPPWLTLVAFVVVVFAVGTLIGFSTLPGAWYESLAKPPFNPPNWIFGPVWSTLYVLIAFAGWRTFNAAPKGRGMQLWVGQMLLNWLWSPVWFGLHLLWPAFVVISLIWLLIVAFIIERWKPDRVAALAFVPYLAWVSFAGVLNLSVALMN